MSTDGVHPGRPSCRPRRWWCQESSGRSQRQAAARRVEAAGRSLTPPRVHRPVHCSRPAARSLASAAVFCSNTIRPAPPKMAQNMEQKIGFRSVFRSGFWEHGLGPDPGPVGVGLARRGVPHAAGALIASRFVVAAPRPGRQRPRGGRRIAEDGVFGARRRAPRSPPPARRGSSSGLTAMPRWVVANPAAGSRTTVVLDHGRYPLPGVLRSGAGRSARGVPAGGTGRWE